MYKISANYKPVLAVRETEHAIVAIKNFFQTSLSTELNLTRVTAPLFVPSGRGINDDLNGVEEPVSFAVKDMGGQRMEIVQSLAKWKRLKVTEMGCKPGFGIYTDMNAIRPDETLDAIHSLYVDQWDWELCIDEKDRNVFFLLDIVKKVYRSLKRTEFYIFDHYSKLSPILPEEIKLIYSDDLQREYPRLTPKERENAAAKKYGAVFIVGIGGKLPDGSVHDGRAPDYDDWITESGDGHVGLNGDLILWNNVLGTAFELSSMGIRVSPESLRAQLKERGMEERAELDFHKRLLNGELSFTLGGGIGQSRLCMFLLRKAHIGETQVSAWPESVRQECKAAGIPLL
ncbi:MAG: aspartate--ammonia ligase [Treponema sp.]